MEYQTISFKESINFQMKEQAQCSLGGHHLVICVNPSLPDDVIEVVQDGNLVARIVNITTVT